MTYKHCHWIPIVQGIWYPVLFIITYAISVLRKDVPAVLPYVSDTGAWPPASFIFSLGLNIGALLMGITAYLRGLQVDAVCQRNAVKSRVPILNKISCYIGYIAAIGVASVGNIQVSHALLAHIFSAGIAFNFGVVYKMIQTYISFVLYPLTGSKCTNIIRMFFTVVTMTCLTICTMFGIASYLMFTGNDITKWTEAHGGFDFHVVSVIAEWIMIHSVVFFMSTFAQELKGTTFVLPKVELTAV